MNNNWFDVWAALIRRRKNHFAIRVAARHRNLFTAAAVRYFRGAISRLCLLLQTWIGKKWCAPWEAADLLRIVNELLFCGAHTSCCRANERLSERERANRICAGCTYTREWGSPPVATAAAKLMKHLECAAQISKQPARPHHFSNKLPRASVRV